MNRVSEDTRTCPSCGRKQQKDESFLGDMGMMEWYRCRYCGGEWSIGKRKNWPNPKWYKKEGGMSRADKIATRIVAEEMSFAEKQINKVISMLSYLPVSYNFTDIRQGEEVERAMKEVITRLEQISNMFPSPVTFVISGVTSGRMVEFDDAQKMIAWLASNGIRQTGVQKSGVVRQELRGRPIFDKLLGPMYDGPKRVRYETQEVYNQMSQ